MGGMTSVETAPATKHVKAPEFIQIAYLEEEFSDVMSVFSFMLLCAVSKFVIVMPLTASYSLAKWFSKKHGFQPFYFHSSFFVLCCCEHHVAYVTG
jgi:hypothetical protein